MSAIRRTLENQQEHNRCRLHVARILAARHESERALRWPSEVGQHGPSLNTGGGTPCDSEVRIVAACRRRNPTALFLARRKARGPGWLGQRQSRNQESSDNDTRNDVAKEDSAALASSPSSIAATLAAAVMTLQQQQQQQVPPGVEALYNTYSTVPSISSCANSARHIGIADPDATNNAMAAIPAMVVHVGLIAIVEASRRLLGRAPEMVAARNNARRLIINTAESLRAREGSSGGGDRDVSLWRYGITLRDTFLHCAELDWQQLDKTLDKNPLLRSLAFAEACRVPEVSELRDALVRLRPKLILVHPNTWGRMLEAALHSRSDTQMRTVLDYAVRGVVLLLDSGVPDEQLHPIFCAELSVLILLLRLDASQLESFRKRPGRETLASYAAALRDAVRDAFLTDTPYRYLSPGQLYNLLCTSALGDGPADCNISSYADVIWAQRAGKYVHERLVAILTVLEPSQFVVALTETALVMAIFEAGPHYETSPDVQDALKDVLAAKTVLVTAQGAAVRAGAGELSWSCASAGVVSLPGSPAPVKSVDAMDSFDPPGLAAGAKGVNERLEGGHIFRREVLGAQGGAWAERPEAPANAVSEGPGAAADAQPDAVTVAEAEAEAETASATDTDAATRERTVGPYDFLRKMVQKDCELAATITSSSASVGGVMLRETDARLDSVQLSMNAAFDSLAWIQSNNLLGEDFTEDPESLAALDDLLRSGQEICWQANGVRECHREQWTDAVLRAATAFIDILQVDLADCLKCKDAAALLEMRLPARALIEALRPGLLAAHPGTWGELIRLLEAKLRETEAAGTRRDGRSSDMAFRVMGAAIRCLVCLAGQEMPLQVLGLSWCVLGGVVFMIQLDQLEKQYPAEQDKDHMVNGAASIASLAFRCLRFTPLIQALKAKSGRSAVAVTAAAVTPLPPPPSHGVAVPSSSYRSGPQLASLETVVASLGIFSTTSPVPTVAVLLSAYMTDWVLERWQRRGWQPSGPGRLWPRRVSESEGRLTEEPNKRRVVRHLAVLCGVSHGRKGGAGSSVDGSGHKRELAVEEDKDDVGPGLGRPGQLQGAQELRRVNEHSREDATTGVAPSGSAGFVFLSDGAVRVTTRVVQRPAVSAVAATTSSWDASARSSAHTNDDSCRSSSTTSTTAESIIGRNVNRGVCNTTAVGVSHGANSHITGTVGGQRPVKAGPVVSELAIAGTEGAATFAARGSGPVVFRSGCGVSELIRVLDAWSQIMEGLAHSNLDVRCDVVLEGCEALAMFMMIFSMRNGPQLDAVVSLQPCFATCGADTAGCATAHAETSNEKKAEGRDLPPRLEPLRLSLVPGYDAGVLYNLAHGPGEASRGPHFVTITAFSKVLQLIKVVRKALRDENAGVFEVRAQGFEGLRRALQLVSQVCSDMRAVQRDLIFQPTVVSFRLHDDGEGLANRQGASSIRQQPQPPGRELANFIDTVMGVVEDVIQVQRMFFQMGDTEYCASGDTIATLGKAEEDLKWLWHQVRDRGPAGGPDGGGGVREALYVTMLLAECTPGRPRELIFRRTEGSVRPHHEGRRRHLAKVMMSA
ncbi:hypothetical protein Vretimale_18903 [Volvox reticuliferus]|uniref:Uncharacterized protein n=1 Tax=Volvox reticuliferus TaxID=1737510 RepID=A0A8J4GY13_9CHLO|nr:hypothetical protein Vretifemale_17295 [Volvox reticuliferus]GIM16311.1 hypothetical protein Vretimale_18903 [Volvox reticuliferus]